MPKIVDARGLACPQPVILTKKALEDVDNVTTIVDNDAAVENVLRLASDQGCKLSIEKKGESIYLHMAKRETKSKQPATTPVPKTAPLKESAVVPVSESTLLFIASDKIGSGAEELGNILMRSFIHTLGEVNHRPGKIIFMNSGVKLVAKGSDVIEDLSDLTKKGTKILACGTCLDYYNLKKSVRVGLVSNMYDITTAILQAEKIISI